MAELDIPVHDPEAVRQATEAVLSRPEFAEARPAWWEEVLRIIGEMLDRLVTTAGSGGRGSVIGVVVLAAFAAAIALGVIRFGRTLGRDPAVDMTVEGPVGRSAADWLAEADRHERQGEWRAALRCRYRALLADLAAQGLVEEVAGRTTGEYLASVTADVPDAAASFAAATAAFERAWYGHGEVGAADVERFAATVHQVLRDAEVTAGAASA
ncbi:MAG TPA: DUF4129 domain-containing protein [Egibacteraceae bacterium]|nr:DUF4129 domain-containing protein [Egibacteraceae bacterium]